MIGFELFLDGFCWQFVAISLTDFCYILYAKSLIITDY